MRLRARALLALAVACSIAGCRSAEKQPGPSASAQGPSVVPAGGGAASVDDLGRAVFEALRANDPARFSTLFANDTDVLFVTTKSRGDRALLEARIRGDVERGKSSFGRVRREAAVPWESVRFGRVEHVIGTSDGVEGTDAKLVVVQVDGREQRIVLNNCVKTPRGWVLGGTLRLP